ncbi:hypothetical protein KTH81_12445 [Lachnospiraceae bacterium ASD3451]|nr:hypothetical protein [Diplocloster agilis]
MGQGCRTHLALFPGASHARCLGLGTAGGIRGRSGVAGFFWISLGARRACAGIR